MSEQTTEAAATETKGTATTEQKREEPKPSETVDFWKQKAREQEKRAKDNADAAKRLADLEDAQKSETEKAADRIAKAEAEVASVPGKVSEALRTHLIALHKISDEDAELFLTASEPELLLKQVDRLVARDATATEERRRRGNHVPGEGSTERPTADPGPGLARLRAAYASPK
jgi:predicted phage tail protein